MLRRRYEILLPLQHNDGRLVSDEILEQTREELLEQFDGVSVLPGSVRGFWVFQGVRYEDASARVIVDVEDTEDHRLFFRDFKEKLKQRFEQIEIYIASYLIELV
jgi:hypothetical protein